LKKLIVFLFCSVFLYSYENPYLIDFAKRYTKSNSRDIYKLAYDFANSSIHFGNIKDWERQRYRSINKKELNEHIKNGTEFNYVIGLINHSPEYIRLLTMLNQYYKHEEDYRLFTPRLYRSLHYNSHYPEIVNLKKFLTLIQNGKFEYYDDLYDDDLVYEIKIFQHNHGLSEDGRIGPATRKWLNMTFDEVVDKIKINLEIEMSKKDKPDTYIYVNIPEYKMYLISNDTEILSMNVVVGKKTNKTPIFNEDMKYVVINPEWNVPTSIYKKEYKHKSMNVLSRKGFYLNDEGQLVQGAGKRNALGLVKFMFPNKYSVYMHDTPAKSLFKKRIRAFSHGCIRLEKPFDLLEELGIEYSGDEENLHIELDNKIPVYIEYNTAWIDSNGILQFREDIYGYEKLLFK